MNPQATIDRNKVWKYAVIALIRTYKKGTRFTYDKVRAEAAVRGVTPPDHPNAWGAAMNTAAKEQLIAKTGRYFPSAIRSNHGRIMPEWVRL